MTDVIILILTPI